MGVWGTVGSVVLAVLILLAMITVHEFGHYLAGKLLHFRIDEFSVGFGPALFKRKSKKTGELFALRLIPLGGYCAFAGEEGAPEGETAVEDRTPAGGEEGAPHCESGEAAPQNGAERDRSGFFTEKKPWQRIVVLVSGALMNYLLALVLLIVCFFAYGQTLLAVYEVQPSQEIPAEYCLQDRDIFLEAEGEKLYLTTDLARVLNGKHGGDMIAMRVSRVVGTDGNGRSLREEKEIRVMLRGDVSVNNSADLNDVWRALGIRSEENEDGESFLLANASYRFTFGETLGRGLVYSFKIAGSIFQVLGELLTGKLGISALGGPVTTIAVTSQIAGRSLRGFLEIAGYIGVNLAVFNLLPIPALDGSKVVFTLIEWIRKKPVSRKVEAVIHAVGFVLLLGFAVLVDILQFV